MKKSELLLNPYKEHLKKPYLHGAGTLEINGVQYSADEYITMLEEENKKLNEENELLKQCLDKLMFDADIANVKIHGELGDYVYVRSDRQFKLNVKD